MNFLRFLMNHTDSISSWPLFHLFPKLFCESSEQMFTLSTYFAATHCAGPRAHDSRAPPFKEGQTVNKSHTCRAQCSEMMNVMGGVR